MQLSVCQPVSRDHSITLLNFTRPNSALGFLRGISRISLLSHESKKSVEKFLCCVTRVLSHSRQQCLEALHLLFELLEPIILSAKFTELSPCIAYRLLYYHLSCVVDGNRSLNYSQQYSLDKKHQKMSKQLFSTVY